MQPSQQPTSSSTSIKLADETVVDGIIMLVKIAEAAWFCLSISSNILVVVVWLKKIL